VFFVLSKLRQRKEGICNWKYFLWQMDTPHFLHSQMTVEEVLSRWPNSHSAFTTLGTRCVGCLLQKFCTLRDVAEIYQLPYQELTGELEKYVPTRNKHKGV